MTDKMSEEEKVIWKELSKAALTDKEGILYKEKLDPRLVSMHANFSKTFWLQNHTLFHPETLELNPNLHLDEIREIYGEGGAGINWHNISANRKLTVEEISEQKNIRTNTVFYENVYVQHTFKKEDWDKIDQIGRKRMLDDSIEITPTFLTWYRVPETILSKKWDVLNQNAKLNVSRYQPISYKFALSKKEDISNYFLETENRAHLLNQAQLMRLRQEISKHYDQLITDGFIMNWENALYAYTFTEWFLEKYRKQMSKRIYEDFLKRIKE